MSGEAIQQHGLFSYGSLEERVPANHPLRPIRTMVDEALKASVRSERMLMERLEYNLLFRWFVGLSANEPVWRPTVDYHREKRSNAAHRAAAERERICHCISRGSVMPSLPASLFPVAAARDAWREGGKASYSTRQRAARFPFVASLNGPAWRDNHRIPP
jgi:hypothetical protein